MEQQQYLAKLQSQCLPGQKLITCMVPKCQQVISCVRYGQAGGKLHPGGIGYTKR